MSESESESGCASDIQPHTIIEILEQISATNIQPLQLLQETIKHHITKILMQYPWREEENSYAHGVSQIIVYIDQLYTIINEWYTIPATMHTNIIKHRQNIQKLLNESSILPSEHKVLLIQIDQKLTAILDTYIQSQQQ